MPGGQTTSSILLLGALTMTDSSAQTATQPEAEAEALQEVIIVAPYGMRLPQDQVPANVQTATADEIEDSQSLDLTDFINRSFASVNINHAQNNPLQPDFNFRGFTASPLLGLSPGLTVYQNGVRINEPFGDTVSWDLIPLSAIGAVQLLAGTNPVFGLNTLGGALSLQMKTGFAHPRTQAEIYGGSFTRSGVSVEHGGNDGRWGYYANVDYFEESGWRQHSRSDALRFYGALSLRGDDSAIDLGLAIAETELRGNGATPIELLALDREQVFTHPDLTENTLMQVILEGNREISGALHVAGNAFYRRIDTDSFNGDGSIFEECDVDGRELLIEDEFDDLDGDGECTLGSDGAVRLVFDMDGNPIEAQADDAQLDAINNIGRRRQDNYGISLQLGLHSDWGGRDNDLTLGAAFSQGRTAFDSAVEVVSLLEDRSTSRTGIFAAEFMTDVRNELSVSSLYLADTLTFDERSTLTLAGRYDSTHIRLTDRSGQSPELNGSHEFERFNPAVGLTFRATPSVTLYGSLSQSARAPTAVELACASEDAPCNLPNAFLADPPLEQVVATSAEVGMRGTRDGLRWSLGAFHTTNEDDILFQTSGGPQANVGFFANVGDTRREGVELSLSLQQARARWSLKYSLIDATFEDAFVVNSPNHPVFDEAEPAPQIVGAEKLRVSAGATIPGVPRHQANVGIDFTLGGPLMLGADLVYRSGVYLRGDEVNLLGKTDGYAILNLRGEYRLSGRLAFFARIENALDEDYETFGLLGEPDEVFPGFDDPRFLGAGPPFGAWVGVKVNL